MTQQKLLQISKPILFNTEMVQAILDNRKTVTRRVVKLPMDFEADAVKNISFERIKYTSHLGFTIDSNKLYQSSSIKPPVDVSDYLYVRETWRLQNYGYHTDTDTYDGKELEYRADFSDIENEMYGRRGGCSPCKWHTSIHMPKEVARIFLRVTDVRVEKLQDITNDDCHKEGIDESGSANFGSHYNPQKYDFSIEKYQTLWDSPSKSKTLTTMAGGLTHGCG